MRCAIFTTRDDDRRQCAGRGAKSIIVCALNYNTPLPYSIESAASESSQAVPRGWISRYAWGDDYHESSARSSTRWRLQRAEFRDPFAGRSYVDTGPIAERIAAERAGLGWLAKHLPDQR